MFYGNVSIHDLDDNLRVMFPSSTETCPYSIGRLSIPQTAFPIFMTFPLRLIVTSHMVTVSRYPEQVHLKYRCLYSHTSRGSTVGSEIAGCGQSSCLSICHTWIGNEWIPVIKRGRGDKVLWSVLWLKWEQGLSRTVLCVVRFMILWSSTSALYVLKFDSRGPIIINEQDDSFMVLWKWKSYELDLLERK